MDPPSDPNEQPESSSQGVGEGAGSRREIDLWCAISESPSLANAPAPAIDANLWQVEAAAGGATELEAAAAGAGGMLVPAWCTDDGHDHVPSSSVGVPRFPADSTNLCSMRDVDLGTPGYRFGVPPNQALGRQESLELLAETWAQLVPDELVERFSQDELRHFQDDLEQFLILDSNPGLLPMHPPGGALGTPETPTNDESAETVSSSGLSIGDTPEEGAVITSSGESQGASVAAPSPGSHKRKGPALDPGVDSGEAGASPQSLQQQHQQSVDTLQKKLKVPAAERPSVPRTTRPRYAIQTKTEVDVIDDGYRWRKYGQKPVKNSVHPRNYYRCTTANCPVRKRVERSSENPSHVLTTYDGTHNHPEIGSTGGSHARELNPPGNVASSNADQDVPVPAPISPQQPVPLGPMPPRLPPSNYIAPNIISHLLAAGSQVPSDQARQWSHPSQVAGTIFQRNIDFLRMHQLFRLQYGTQYPLLSNMLSLMRNFARARPPIMDPRLDPRLASLLAAQSYNSMRLGGQTHQDPTVLGSAGPVLDSQQQGSQLTSPSTTSGAALGTTTSSSAGPSVGPSNLGYISMAQRLLWQQELMGEGFGGETGHSSQQPASHNSGAAEKEGPENHPDVGDPPA